MSTRSAIVDFFGIVRSAIVVSSAAEARRPAPRHHLARLGIDAEQFNSMSRR
jgi:hypothetical protein